DDLAERPERDTVAVGKAAALPPDDIVLTQGRQQLEHEPALADPRHAYKRDQLRRALAPSAIERVAQKPELVFPPDQFRRPALDDIDAKGRACGHRQPRPHRLRLALRLDRFRLAVLDP